ncbi:hypothetical protein SAMN05428963_107179 [Consotaella salsifontis]|uniref:YlxR domain-containing protein n=1 Tax=Consotaella salsifontis TaxID=1365950 RepID=A0A1T4RQQ1_9HYPH|nr:hypothetical protein SAMN05428963_107179 [Consotaella salsifontis]
MNERMCIVSRERHPAEALIRFVLAPDGSVVADLKRRLPGRGAHVEARREAVDQAVKRRLFSRALHAEARASETLGDEVDMLLKSSVLGSLGLARKARQLLTGAAKVEAAVRSGRAIGLLHANDGASDGIRKMDAARRAASLTFGEIPAFQVLSSEEMGLALGGINVIHAAVLTGDAGNALVKRLKALSSYRGEGPRDESGGCGVPPAQEAEAE